MSGQLRKEIRQMKPFASLEEEALLNLLKTAEVVSQRTAALLKNFGLSLTQYNVLRILRGAGSAGLACSKIAERMITKESDMTRLLDRMESAGLVQRERSKTDRRIVLAGISQAGLTLLEDIEPMRQRLMQRTMGAMPQADLSDLVGHLERVRKIWS